MTMTDAMLLTGVTLAAYSLISLSLSRALQPLRLIVIDRINSIAEDETVPEAIQDDLDRLGNSLFSNGRGWLLLVAFPVSAIYTKLRRRDNSSPVALHDHPRRNDIATAFVLGAFCMIASSPIRFAILLVELFFLVLLSARMGRAARRALHTVLGLNDQYYRFKWAN